jgi:hypothetical protein
VLDPGGRDRGPFLSKWPKRWRQRAGRDAWIAGLGTDDRALRRVVRVVLALAPQVLVDNPTLTRAFDALPVMERRGWLASDLVARDAALYAWAESARARLDGEATPTTGVQATGALHPRDPWWDVYLDDAAARIAGRALRLDEAWTISREWIARVQATADRRAPWWRHTLPGLEAAAAVLVAAGVEHMTAAHLVDLVATRTGTRPAAAGAVARPHRRDASWRLDVLWQLALTTQGIEVEWLHDRLRRELAAAIAAPRRPGWLHAWAEDPRTPGVDLVRFLAMVELRVYEAATRLATTRLHGVVRTALLHPALPPEALDTPLLDLVIDATHGGTDASAAVFARRFAERWGRAPLPVEVGVRVLRSFMTSHAPLLPSMPSLEAAMPWMPPSEWATLLAMSMTLRPEPVRSWAMARMNTLSDAQQAEGFRAFIAAGTRVRAEGGPLSDALASMLRQRDREHGSARSTLVLAPAYVLDRGAGVAHRVVHVYVDGHSLTHYLNEVERLRRGGARGVGEGPFTGTWWTETTAAVLRGGGAPEAGTVSGRFGLVACTECDVMACGGGVDAEVVVEDETVTWRALALVHSPALPLAGVPPFRFDREAYEQVLDDTMRLLTLLPQTVVLAERAEPV